MTRRLFLFEDDILRIHLASAGLGTLLRHYPWGAKVWLPVPGYVQALQMGILPFGPVTDALVGNFTSVAVSVILIHRLSRRITRGPASLIAPALFALSPSTAWLATGGLGEPVLILLLLGECLLLVRAVETGSRLDYLLGAALASGAMLCRYEAWFVCPFALAGSAAWTRFRRGHGGAWQLATAGVSLLPPIIWMVAAQLRFGDPIATLRMYAEIIRGHNSQGFWRDTLLPVFSAAAEVGVPGWVFLAAATFLLCRRMTSKANRQIGVTPALWIPLSLFLPFVILFLFSMVSGNLGWPLARFMSVWFALGIVSAGLPLSNAPPSAARRVLAVTVALCLASFPFLDSRRPNAYEYLACRALETVEFHAAGRDRKSTAAILFPPGSGEIAVNSVFLFAPSVESKWVNPERGRFAEAALASDADFLVFRREYWPVPDPGAPWDVVHSDEFFFVLARTAPRASSPRSPSSIDTTRRSAQDSSVSEEDGTCPRPR